MKSKSHQHRQYQTSTKRTFISILISTGIIILGLIIGLSSLGFFSKISFKPSFIKAHAASPLQTQTLVDYINTQPGLRIVNEPKLMLVEIGNIDCEECAKFNGYQKDKNELTDFEKLNENLIATGLVDYVWLDNLQTKDENLTRINNLLHCTSEIQPRKFLKLKKYIAQRYDIRTSLEIKTGISDNDLSNEVEVCIESGKYNKKPDEFRAIIDNEIFLLPDPGLNLFLIETYRRDLLATEGERLENQIIPYKIVLEYRPLTQLDDNILDKLIKTSKNYVPEREEK